MTISLISDIFSNVVVVLIETILGCISTAVYLCIHDISYYHSILSDKAQSIKTAMVPMIEPMVLETVFWWNKQWVYLSHSSLKYLAEYPWFQYTLQRGAQWYTHGRSLLCRIHDVLFIWYPEPEGDTWTRISYTLFGISGIQRYMYYEDVIQHATFETSKENALDIYLCGGDCHKILMSIFLKKEYSEYIGKKLNVETTSPPLKPEVIYDIVSAQVQDTFRMVEMVADLFVTTKQNNAYISRIYSPKNMPTLSDFQLPVTRSNVRLLGVYYIHPEMKQPISIVLPENLFYTGNHILCTSHILQCLRQLPIYTKYVFDARYVLSIIDHNIERICLHYNQYLVLGEKEYQIQSM